MRAIGTILKWVILLPILAVVLLVAVANGQIVRVHLNPFDTADPVLKIDLALYQIAFIVFVLGVLVGGLVAWSGQRRHRRRLYDMRERASAEATRPPERVLPASAGFLPRPERS